MSEFRSIDHLVLPTASLAVARARLRALGFTVAPDGQHPFGTENCCVYLADGTFLEPLAVADQTAARLATDEGNVFVARDAAYRERQGDEGFSALVFRTQNAVVDHAYFQAAGISAGNMLEFSRPFVDASGKSDTASFRLAFAGEARGPDTLFFTCQRVNAPDVDRSALERHANGVTSLGAVVLTAGDPRPFGRFFDLLTRNSATSAETSTGSEKVAVISVDDYRAAVGDTSDDNQLRLRAVIFQVADLAALETLLRANQIDYAAPARRLVVPAAPGQGAVFVFAEA